MEMNANTTWQWMILIAFTLGLRHGFDLDHIATIDAMTRTVRDNRILSKIVGLLFSVGHGFVVTLVSLIIGCGLVESLVPQWLEGFGNLVSIFFLFVFGVLNLWNVFQNSPSAMPAGIKSYVVKKMGSKKFSPLLILLIGALFACSFDTFSQIALFSISASLTAGWIFSGVLGISFTLGMIVTDGLNGLFVSKIIQRADTASLIVSRSLGLIISLFSLVIGSIALVKIFQPSG